MFIDPGKVKRVEVNKENIEYYNNLYAKMSGDGPKIEELSAELKLKSMQPSCLNRWFCCKKPVKMEDLPIEEIVYSSGESGDDENRLGRVYLKMRERQKENHIRKLWTRLMAKVKGAVLVIDRFKTLSRRIYLFGTSKKLKFIIEEEKQVPCFIIMPSSRVRNAWNLVVFFLLMYTATLVPFRTIFIEVESKSGFLYTFDMIVDLLYTVDLFLNFFMAFEDADKKMEVRLKKISSNYLRTWFTLDLISCIPFQYIEIEDSNDDSFGGLGKIMKMPRIYKMIKILRLFKLVRLMKYSRSIKKILQAFKMNQGIKRMITVTITMLFAVHLMGCVFFLVAKFEDLEANTWVARAGLIYALPSRQYLFAVNWALQTLTTVGYGEIAAVTGSEQTTALIWMVVGVGFYSFTIGNLSSIISDVDIKAAILQEKISAMQDFVKRNPNLPGEIEAKIRRFLQNNHNEHLQKFDQEKLINELPSNLKS
jgi:hypothetical protein